jgi:transcriptional regulator with XRE-family HTH domain
MIDEVLRLRSLCGTMDVAKRSTHATVEPTQAKELGQQLRTRREELGLSLRQLEKLADVDNGTIVRIEQGAFAAPAPDKLARIAEALDLSLADVFALAEYAVPGDLPSFQPYLRTKYRDMPREAVDDLNKAFARIVRKHGYDPEGPQRGEDEAP